LSRISQKEATRQRILECALTEFRRQGYLKANTASIARAAGVAHGTIFLHFHTKDELLFELIRRRLILVSNKLFDVVKDSESFEILLRIHLNHIDEELEFESMIARELPVMPVHLRRQIITIRGGILADFYQAMEKEIRLGLFRAVDPAVALQFWFGTLTYYLANQDMFAPKDQIIHEKGEDMIRYFINTLKR
jgi:AcrR family transcriptional regulator